MKTKAQTPQKTISTAPAPLSTPGASAVHTPTQTAAPVMAEKDLALKSVTDVQQVARLIGENAINDTIAQWGLNGTDLGSMFDKDGRLYMLFGDSFGCCIPGTGGPGNAADWRNNCMAVISDRNPQDGLKFDAMITDRPGHAMQILPKAETDFTIIPTYGVAVGSRMVLHYMAVKSWGKAGEWFLNESGLAYSDDDGQTWVKPPEMSWDGKSNFGQAAFVKHGDDLYVFGIPGGRFGGVKLARVRQSEVLNKSAYLYFSGLDGNEPAWQPEEEKSSLIVPAPVGELSVVWNDFLGRWIMTYLDEFQSALVIREARELWGPWGPSKQLVSGQAFPALYGAYMHPWYVENKGETIYFAMSQWGPYTVYWMKARLVKA